MVRWILLFFGLLLGYVYIATLCWQAWKGNTKLYSSDGFTLFWMVVWWPVVAPIVIFSYVNRKIIEKIRRKSQLKGLKEDTEKLYRG